MGLVLSIDVGTTNAKAGVVDEEGRIVSLRKSAIALSSPETGAAEHDAEVLFQLLLDLATDAAARYKDQIEVLALSTYQFGMVLLDNDLKPLGGISLLSDIRAQQTFENFIKDRDTDALYLHTGCPPMFQYPLSRLYYFKQNHPEIFSKARYVLSSKDYLVYRFSGELLAEPSVSCATQMLDVQTLNWSPEVCQSIGLDLEQLPPLVDGTTELLGLRPEISAKMGLSSGVQLLPGLYDGGALAVGLSGLEPQVGVMNVGTSAMLRVPSASPVFDTTGNLRVNPYPLRKGVYLNGGALNNAALPLDWLRSKLFEIDLLDFQIVEESSDSPPMFCIPYLTGERNPRLGAFASGVMFGMRTYHTRNDVARSMMEGVAYSLKMVSDSLADNDVKVKELRMAGGGTAWKIWPQIFADVFGMPIFVPKAQEIALVGSAILAQHARGAFPSIEEAALSMVNAGERIEPNTQRHQRYAEHYQFFNELCESMIPLYEKAARLS